MVRGIRDAHVILSLEPVHPRSGFPLAEMRSWVQRIFPSWEAHMAQQPLGCTPNTRKALALGFGRADFTILAEEDIEVADDVLEYFTWAQRYRDDPDALAVCAHSKEAGSGTECDVFTAPWFSPLVWGTWRDRHDSILVPAWEQQKVPWDAVVRDTGAAHPGRYCVFPACSRALHFGEVSNHTPRRADGAPNYFHLSALSKCYRPHYDQQDYRETQVAGAVLY